MLVSCTGISHLSSPISHGKACSPALLALADAFNTTSLGNRGTFIVAYLSDRLWLRGPIILATLPIAIIGYAVVSRQKVPSPLLARSDTKSTPTDFDCQQPESTIRNALLCVIVPLYLYYVCGPGC